MIKFNPSRILHGSDLSRLFEEAEIKPRLGGYALLIADSDLRRSGVVNEVRNHLESAGIESILFEITEENANSGMIREAVSLASGGRAGYIIALGPEQTLDIGKIVSLTVGTGRDVHDFIDKTDNRAQNIALPFLGIPTRCWNPLLFTGLAVIGDARDGAARPVKTGVLPDTVFFGTELQKNLTGKQVLYDLLCILGSSIEENNREPGSLGYPLIFQAFISVVSILRDLPSGDTPPDRGAVQIAGIHGAWFSTNPGAGNALGRAAHVQIGIAPEWVAAALLPGVARHWMEQDPARIQKLLTMLELEKTGDQRDDTELVEREIRSLMALADVPLRLRDLGVESRVIPGIAESASSICGIDTGTLGDLLRASL